MEKKLKMASSKDISVVQSVVQEKGVPGFGLLLEAKDGALTKQATAKMTAVTTLNFMFIPQIK